MCAQVFSGPSRVPARCGFRVGSDAEERDIGHQSGRAAVRDLQEPVGPALPGRHRSARRRSGFRGQQPVHRRPRQRGAKSDRGVDGTGRERVDGGRREHPAPAQRHVRPERPGHGSTARHRRHGRFCHRPHRSARDVRRAQAQMLLLGRRARVRGHGGATGTWTRW